ncbi:hypothetical protein QU38_00415, partial [Staphylococcus aureus]
PRHGHEWRQRRQARAEDPPRFARPGAGRGRLKAGVATEDMGPDPRLGTHIPSIVIPAQAGMTTENQILVWVLNLAVVRPQCRIEIAGPSEAYQRALARLHVRPARHVEAQFGQARRREPHLDRIAQRIRTR